MRPMLERIDYTVRHLSANNGDASIPIPPYPYSIADLWYDFKNTPGGVLKVGGSDEVDDYPIVQPRGGRGLNDDGPEDDELKGRVALIGHSAGGWISRVYLSNKDYGGKCYDGSRLVHSLITLGTPHENAPGPAFRGIEWINRETNAATTLSTNCVAVGGTGYKGDESGQLTQNAYSFCCPNGSDGSSYDGDGLTPIGSALAFEGAKKVVLEDVTHFPWSDVFGGDLFAPDLAKDYNEGRDWYGSDDALDQWVGYLNV